MVFVDTKHIGIRLIVVFVLILAHIMSCRDSDSTREKEEYIRLASIGLCKKLLVNPKATEHTKSLAQLTLQKWENNRLDPEPILMFAVLTRLRGKESIRLLLGISDEDADVAGVAIRERHMESNGQISIIEEEYPVFGYGLTITAAQMIPIKIRKGNERKNEQHWKNYLEIGVWDRDMRPDLWVSNPQPGKVDVEIWVYDHAGHKSEPVSLKALPESK